MTHRHPTAGAMQHQPSGANAPRIPLIIVDLQTGFLRGAPSALPARIAGLQNAYTTVIATRFQNPPGSRFHQQLGWTGMTADADLALAFQPAPHTRLLDKTGCATQGHLPALLAERQTAHVHLCGLDTEAGVLAVATELFDAGITVSVLPDHCASSGGPDAHSAGLAVMRRVLGPATMIEAQGVPGPAPETSSTLPTL